MRLLFEKIEIHNFMSFSDEIFVFDDYDGMIRIKGKNHDIPNQLNGSGKSNLSNALVYGLFGELPFKLKNENVSNRYIQDKNTFVSIYFKSDNVGYKITSGLRGRQAYCELFQLNDDKYENITRSTIAETRKFIENEILQCDINLFMRTIYLNSDETYNFYKLKQVDRKEFIDKLFDISIFGDIFNLIHKDKLKMDREIAIIQNRLMILNNSSDDYKHKSENFIEDKNNKIENLKCKIKECKNIYTSSKQNVTETNTELIQKCRDKIRKIEDIINDISNKKQKINLNIAEYKMNIKRLDTQILDRQKIIEKHSGLKQKLCGTCKDILSKHYNLDKYQIEIDKMKEKQIDESQKITSKSTELENYEQKINEYKNKLTQLSNHLMELNVKYENEQKNIRQLELSINSYETQLENIENQENPYLKLFDENIKNIKKESDKLNVLIEEYKYIELSELIVSQENLKKFIIKDLIGLLNNKIKYYLHKLGTNCEIIFDEEMKYDFVTPLKSGIEFNNFSKGEQARISIATCFAFRDFLSTRSNISSNIFILDEFFDSNVDPLALENTINILNDFIKNNNQKIFIVSHRSEICDDIFNHIIMIEKKNNISKIKNVQYI
jgi:DNA repair exonuclease SbcCD ATPase subunit